MYFWRLTQTLSIQNHIHHSLTPSQTTSHSPIHLRPTIILLHTINIPPSTHDISK